MKNRIFAAFLFILIFKIYAENNEVIPFFIVPDSWQAVNPKHYPPYVKISFVKKEMSACRPTLNLAMQKTPLSLEEYVKEAKKIHLEDKSASYRIMQTVQLSQGPAVICKINKKTNGTDFEILQMIFVKDSYAYVMTAACRKNEILNYYPTFMNIFLSFKTADDLFSLACGKEKKEDLIKHYGLALNSLKGSNDKERKKKMALFEKYLDKKFANLGKYFPILFIKQCLQNKGFDQ